MYKLVEVSVTKRFNESLYAVSDRLRGYLSALPDSIKQNVQEIRLRANKPVALTVLGKTQFVCKNAQVISSLSGDLLIAEKEDIRESFRLVCANSVYAHTEEIKRGFVVMKNGNRAGICGSFTEQGMMHNISSINIRIAREIFGAADNLFKNYKGGGVLIAGPPGSGKTTLLRDFIRVLSDVSLRRITVIDSRGELSGSFLGVSVNNLGKNTDILLTQNKAAGIDIAVRTMFPQMVAFDEIANETELKEISNGFACGVDIITTAHISEETDLKKRGVTRRLLESGAISLVAVLDKKLGCAKFFSAKEICEW